MAPRDDVRGGPAAARGPLSDAASPMKRRRQEGEEVLPPGGREAVVAHGTVVFAPVGEIGGLDATTRLVAVAVVTPPPSDADHARVAPRLRRGEFR